MARAPSQAPLKGLPGQPVLPRPEGSIGQAVQHHGVLDSQEGGVKVKLQGLRMSFKGIMVNEGPPFPASESPTWRDGAMQQPCPHPSVVVALQCCQVVEREVTELEEG